MAPLYVDSAVITERGPKRGRNQDCYALVGEGRALAVAEGSPGRPLRGIASRTTIAAIVGYLEEQRFSAGDLLSTPPEQAEAHLCAAFARVQQSLRSRAEVRAHALRGPLGVSVTAALVLDRHLVVAHRGGTACYLVRDGKLQRLTSDGDTIGQSGSDDGQVTSIARAIECRVEPVAGGDVVLLCSDGISEVLAESVVAEIVVGATSARAVCEELLSRAMNAGAEDDMTALVVALASARADAVDE